MATTVLGRVITGHVQVEVQFRGPRLPDPEGMFQVLRLPIHVQVHVQALPAPQHTQEMVITADRDQQPPAPTV